MTDAAFDQTWAQLLDAEQALRALAEGQVREYAGVLERLAHTLAPAESDACKRSDPTYFRRLTAPEWLAFFGTAARGGPPAPGAGWGWGADSAAVAAAAPAELDRLRRDMAVVQAENNRLRDLVQQLRQEKAALAAAKDASASKPAPAGARPAPEPPTPRPPVRAAAKTAPGLPDQPPAQYAGLFGAWPADGLALAALAQTGWSLRQALMNRVAAQLGGAKIKDLRMLFAGLESHQLVRQHVDAVDGTVTADAADGQVRLAIVRLGEAAGGVLAALGIRPVLSEWERLEARDGADQVKHSAWVCALADHARKRGFTTEVCPTAERPRRPDVLLAQAEAQVYAVVRGAELATPWADLTDEHGAVALCTPTRQVRQHLVAAAQAAGVAHGRATDLELLLAGDDSGALWAETW